jgi:hypothetical protein
MSPSGVQKERMVSEDIYVMNADVCLCFNASTFQCVSTLHNSFRFASHQGCVIHEGVNPDGVKLKLSQCHPLFMSAYLHRNAGAVIHTHSINV